jgi:hypothetical protein
MMKGCTAVPKLEEAKPGVSGMFILLYFRHADVKE